MNLWAVGSEFPQDILIDIFKGNSSVLWKNRIVVDPNCRDKLVSILPMSLCREGEKVNLLMRFGPILPNRSCSCLITLSRWWLIHLFSDHSVKTTDNWSDSQYVAIISSMCIRSIIHGQSVRCLSNLHATINS